MAKTKEQKGEIIAKLETAMKESPSTVFVSFSGVSVADESAMRRTMHNESINYFVAKKTLIRRALSSIGLDHTDLPLDGEVAIAYGGGSDATAVARLVHEFGKKLQDKLVIAGGVFKGSIKTAPQMQEIATIPSLHVLRGMLANVINSPLSGLAIALKAIGDKQQQA